MIIDAQTPVRPDKVAHRALSGHTWGWASMIMVRRLAAR